MVAVLRVHAVALQDHDLRASHGGYEERHYLLDRVLLLLRQGACTP
jgi:hypothetical protein